MYVVLSGPIYIDKSITRHLSSTVCINNREKAGNDDVINILTSEDTENTPDTAPGCSFARI